MTQINGAIFKDTDILELVFVVDRSGSMTSIAKDMEGGLLQIVQDQAALPGTCNVSMYTFDTEFTTNFVGKNAKEVVARDLEIIPRGGTAMNDAIVKALSLTEGVQRLSKEKPTRTVVVIVTDGQENSSKEVRSKTTVTNLIKRMEQEYDWQFTFLAADQAGFADGEAYFAGTRSLGNNVKYTSGKLGDFTASAGEMLSRGITAYRGNVDVSLNVGGK